MSAVPASLPPPAVPAAARRAAAVEAAGRRWEIDAVRGLMLVLMTLTHIPTRFSDPLGQPFGFVSAAEGFVLLSAYVAGLVYTRRLLRDGAPAMRSAFLRRALTIYVCQAALLAFLLGAIAIVGVLIEQPAITHLVSFFLERPGTAFFSGLLLLYNPPLLDILPMYILFLVASPLVLLWGTRHGWGAILVSSGLIWLAAQFGLSQAGYDAVVRLTGIPVPFRETGSFEMLAWQFLWVIGLWIGAGEAGGQPAQPQAFPRWAVAGAIAIAAVHLVWRHAIGQAPFPHSIAWSMAYDKWQLGPMRLIDFLALVLLAMHFGPTLVARLPRWRPLERLGRQSLPVFCAHLVIAMLVLLVVGESDPHRSWWLDAAILFASFTALHLVALASEAADRQAAVARARFRERRSERLRRRGLPAAAPRPRAWARWRPPAPGATKSPVAR